MSDNTNPEQVPLEGKVAGVLTERELVINIGASQGVTEEMLFMVLADKPTEVRDPETNEVLGTIDREKVRVKVTEVDEKFSICKTYRVYVTGVPSIADIVGIAGGLGRTRKEIPETLKAEDEDFIPPLSEEESYVKKGDRVIQLFEDE